MRSWWKPLVFGVTLGIVVHVITIIMLPNIVMNVALKRIAEAGGGPNRLFHSQLVTPQSQTIVRSSPDLAYSTCALDLTKGPVEVFIGKGKDYASVAFYADNTDNIFALNDRKMPAEGVRLLVVSDRAPRVMGRGAQVITMPGDRGLMLIRRLAASGDDYARVVRERAGDRCAQRLAP